MSSTNSLLNPPSTIRLGDNNDNNTSIGDTKNSFPTVVKAGTTETAATASIASPDIDSVIQGFQKELDSLSRSFDRIASSRSKQSENSSNNKTTLAPRGQHESSHSQSLSGFDSTPVGSRSVFSAAAAAAAPPPPPTSYQSQPVGGRSDMDSRSTQNSNSRFAADETFATATTTTRCEEPRPVETPVTTHDDYRRRYADIGNSEDDLFPSHTERKLEAKMQTMNQIMNEQSATILRLQRENNALRNRLARGIPQYSNQSSREQPEPVVETSYRPRHNGSRTPRTHDNYSDARNNYDPTTTPNHHYRNYHDDEMMKPTVSSLTTIPRDDDGENTFATTQIPSSRVGFTPGTKFVAELSKFMTLNQGHSVPLSVIIDRHWDKLKYHMRDDANTDL